MISSRMQSGKRYRQQQGRHWIMCKRLFTKGAGAMTGHSCIHAHLCQVMVMHACSHPLTLWMGASVNACNGENDRVRSTGLPAMARLAHDDNQLVRPPLELVELPNRMDRHGAACFVLGPVG
eukprot:347701-Chlamydomonas_euryale.AAC.11